MKTATLLAFLVLIAVSAPAASLWPAGQIQGMIADHRASKVGDIVTIVIEESVSAQNSQSTKADKASNASDAITQFLFPLAASSLGTRNGQYPGTSYKTGNDFSASGQINNKSSLTSKAAVMVTDVLPNGNLVLEGVRRVAMSGENQYMVLRGIVRPEDVTTANTISSSNVANASLEVVNEGSITNTQKKGWLTRLYETLRLY
jgi:flagellar L-ring protein precursor FlgH